MKIDTNHVIPSPSKELEDKANSNFGSRHSSLKVPDSQMAPNV